ncbi:MAG: PepSY domain-containing protein [Gammaproteobacteria bacterium]|nr:PepSY domain-containing protein [Gammaproteobacteria bacterium]
MRANLRALLLLTAALLSLALSPPLLADDSDHDRARQALEAGEILPLRTILRQLERDYPGQIVEVELEHDDDMWVYEIELLRSGGSLIKMKVDASDGTLIGIKGRDIAPGPLPKAKP